MRDLAAINEELRLLAMVRNAIKAEGGQPSSAAADRLLDDLPTTAANAGGGMTRSTVTIVALASQPTNMIWLVVSRA